MKTSLILCLAFMLFAGMTAHARQSPVANVLKEVSIDQRLNEQIPLDLTFRDETGSEVRLQEYFTDKPVVLSLVYYECPMLCTQILNGMVVGFQNMSFSAGNEFDVVTVSINPAEPPALASEKKQAYLERYQRPGAAAGWHFLTGEEPAIRKLADAVGFRYTYDEKTKLYAHAGGIMVLTPQGKLARYFYGIQYPSRDLTFALIEASQNRIGSPVEKLLLLCYDYDPMTGTYGLIIMKALRFTAGITLAFLGALVFFMVRAERRKRALKQHAITMN